jgi:hypothetical protein
LFTKEGIMPRKSKTKTVVLVHAHFGEIYKVKDAYLTGQDEKFLVCEGNFEGVKRLLIAPTFWQSSPEDVAQVYRQFASKHALLVKSALAKDHAKDRVAEKIDLQRATEVESRERQEIADIELEKEDLYEESFSD